MKWGIRVTLLNGRIGILHALWWRASGTAASGPRLVPLWTRRWRAAGPSSPPSSARPLRGRRRISLPRFKVLVLCKSPMTLCPYAAGLLRAYPHAACCPRGVTAPKDTSRRAYLACRPACLTGSPCHRGATRWVVVHAGTPCGHPACRRWQGT